MMPIPMIASDSLMQLLNTNSLTLYILTSVCKFSVLLSIYISHGTEKDNLFHNRELHEFAIISTIPMTLASDPVGKYSWDKLDADHPELRGSSIWLFSSIFSIHNL